MKSVACCLIIALASSAATIAWGQTPPSCAPSPWPGTSLNCLRDLGALNFQGQINDITQQLRELERQDALRRELDNQRFDIDMDAQIRRDDAEYDAWFYREFIQPPQDHYQQRRSRR